MLVSRMCGLTPSPTDSEPCGSKSTSKTLRPVSARAAPRLIVVVVLPTPPFWLQSAMINARFGWLGSGGTGTGRSGIGRPVGPIWPAPSIGSASISAGELVSLTRSE
jgi:hypothetical protein